MAINVRETNLEEIKARLCEMNTDLNKINYLEAALNTGSFTLEIKRFLFGELSTLLEGRHMLERAAKNIANKAGIEPMKKDKIEGYLRAAELYSQMGKVEEADDMFRFAARDTIPGDHARVVLARKNIYMKFAKELEAKLKRASSLKFYERLFKMQLEEAEKASVKKSLLELYKALGLFSEAKMLEGM
jgi:lipopolysaccharide biosynthesis regulator YciM